MIVPSGNEMADALSCIGNTLYGESIITPEGLTALNSVVYKLKKMKNEHKWKYSVSHGLPIYFDYTCDKNNKIIQPQITVKEISVDGVKGVPYIYWDITVEVFYVDEPEEPFGRWHYDLANDGQPGPLLHMQFGGHFPNARKYDFPLKEPRLHSPVMDIALLSEMIAANFFQDRWNNIRDTPSWCESISLSQKLCFSPYVNKLNCALNTASTTALNSMWNDNWHID